MRSQDYRYYFVTIRSNCLVFLCFDREPYMDAQENLPYYIPNDIVEVSDMSSGSELDSRSQGEEETNSTEDAVMDVVSNSDSIELVPEHRVRFY